LDFKAISSPHIAFNGLSRLIEPPLLLLGILSVSSDCHIIGVSFHKSVHWKLRDNIEWPVDVESKFFVESLGLSLCHLVKIEDLPSLVGSVGSSTDLDILSFFIL
jgi:hypothetical protein